MAQKLMALYEEARGVGGMKAMMRMALLTKIPSNKADAEPDSPENIAAFEKALAEIKKGNG